MSDIEEFTEEPVAPVANNEINIYPKSLFDFDKRPLSYSSLKPILKSPLHFAHNWVHGKEKPKSKALKFGSLLDMFLFFPEEFEKAYCIKPKFEGTGARQREKDWIEDHKTFQLATKEEIDDAKKMAEAIKTNPKTKWLYEKTTNVQLEIRYTDKKTGLKYILRLDAEAEHEGKKIVWDLKSTTDASKEKYEKDAATFNYPLQGRMYCDGYIRKNGHFPDFYQIVCEKGEPYAVNTFRADNTFLEVGKKQFEKATQRVLYCMEHDCFNQGYDFLNDVGYDVLSVPPWEKNKWLE